MTVKTKHGTFNVTDITFKARRELHVLEVSAVNTSGAMDNTRFFRVLDWILDYSFSDAEKHLGSLDDNQIDEVLMSIYNQYKEPNKKK